MTNWRKYFEYLGFTQECEEQAPGYTKGLICFLIVLAITDAALAYAVFWKIQ